jgi:16S rRNA (guanine527-N7)-methyltransferase
MATLTYSQAMSVEAVSGVLALAGDWSHALDAGVAERVALYLERLLEWNRRVNLTGARTFADLLGEHLPDSFAMSRLVPPASSVVDVGAGGGLPGIPFAILRPDCRTTLLEPRAKRVAFLNTAVRECAYRNALVVRGRLEEVESPHFDVAVSRATFPPDEWLDLAPRLLASSGRAIVLATDPVRPRADSARLVDSLEYRASSGSGRWAGCYCFT